MSFICISIKSAFHNNGFALRLALKQRRGGNSKMAYWSLEDCFELLTVITSLKLAEKRNTTCMIHVVFQMDFHRHVSFVCVRQVGFPLSHNVKALNLWTISQLFLSFFLDSSHKIKLSLDKLYIHKRIFTVKRSPRIFGSLFSG